MKLRGPLPTVIVSLLVLGSALSLLRQQGQLQFLELAAFDLLVANVPSGPDAPTAVSLVLITEPDIQALGNWPLTDAQLHDILKRIIALQPEIIGLDIYRDLAVPPGTAELLALFRQEAHVIGIEKFPGEGSPGIPPPAELQRKGNVGFSDLVVDRGGLVRRSLLFQNHDQRTGFAFALQLALRYLYPRGIAPTESDSEHRHMRLGEVTFVPLDRNDGGYVDADTAGYQVMLGYRDEPNPFPMHSMGELLRGEIDPDALRGRIVIVGIAAESVKDNFATPFSVLDSQSGILAGSTVHAHAVQQLVDAGLQHRQPLRMWRDATEYAWILLWLVLGSLASWFAGPSWRFVTLMLAGIGVAVGVAVAAYTAGWWVPVVPNLLAWLLAAALSSALLAAHRRRDQQKLMSLFGRHVSREVANTIWQRRDEVLVDGCIRPHTRCVTTLFTDLQGFTQRSDRMPPQAFFDWLNSYMAELTDVILQHGGVLDDYAGDGIKASFGVLFSEPGAAADQAERAVSCALQLGNTLTRLNHQWRSKGRDCVGMRIGIHTGTVIVGTVGSASRMKYTTVGRNVNIAARLEAIKEVRGPDPNDDGAACRILISGDTAKLIDRRFGAEDIGRYALKGIDEKIRVFAIIKPMTQERHHANLQPQ